MEILGYYSNYLKSLYSTEYADKSLIWQVLQLQESWYFIHSLRKIYRGNYLKSLYSAEYVDKSLI